jgi:hypothetical protein
MLKGLAPTDPSMTSTSTPWINPFAFTYDLLHDHEPDVDMADFIDHADSDSVPGLGDSSDNEQLHGGAGAYDSKSDSDGDDDGDSYYTTPPLKKNKVFHTMPNGETENTFSQTIAFSGKMPKLLLMIVIAIFVNMGMGPRTHGVEMFAGVHSISNGLSNIGYSCQGMDMSTVSEQDDVLKSNGFLRACAYVMGLEPDGR